MPSTSGASAIRISRAQNCTVSDYLSLVDQFMDRMGLVDAPVVGHSMGGTIAIRLGLEYPHRVSRLILVSAPVVGRSCTPIIKLASNPTLNRMFWKPAILETWGRPLLHRWIATNWQVWYREILEDVLKVTPEAAQQSGYTPDPHRPAPAVAPPENAGAGDARRQGHAWCRSPSCSTSRATAPHDTQTVPFDKSQHFPMLDTPPSSTSYCSNPHARRPPTRYKGRRSAA